MKKLFDRGMLEWTDLYNPNCSPVAIVAPKEKESVLTMDSSLWNLFDGGIINWMDIYDELDSLLPQGPIPIWTTPEWVHMLSTKGLPKREQTPRDQHPDHRGGDSLHCHSNRI